MIFLDACGAEALFTIPLANKHVIPLLALAHTPLQAFHLFAHYVLKELRHISFQIGMYVSRLIYCLVTHGEAKIERSRRRIRKT